MTQVQIDIDGQIYVYTERRNAMFTERMRGKERGIESAMGITKMVECHRIILPSLTGPIDLSLLRSI